MYDFEKQINCFVNKINSIYYLEFSDNLEIKK